MIPVPSGVRVWLATGATDMRRGMNGLALQVQQALGRDPLKYGYYQFRFMRDAIRNRAQLDFSEMVTADDGNVNDARNGRLY